MPHCRLISTRIHSELIQRQADLAVLTMNDSAVRKAAMSNPLETAFLNTMSVSL